MEVYRKGDRRAEVNKKQIPHELYLPIVAIGKGFLGTERKGVAGSNEVSRCGHSFWPKYCFGTAGAVSKRIQKRINCQK